MGEWRGKVEMIDQEKMTWGMLEVDSFLDVSDTCKFLAPHFNSNFDFRGLLPCYVGLLGS